MKTRTIVLPLLLAVAFVLAGCAATSQDSGMSSDEKMMSEGEGEMMQGEQDQMMAKEGEMMAKEGEMMAEGEMGHPYSPSCTCEKCVAEAIDHLGFKVIEMDAKPYLAVRFTMMTDTGPEEMGPLMESKFMAVGEALKAKEMKPAGPGFSLYYGEVEGGWDMAVGMTTESEVEAEGFQTGMLPGGEVLAAWHKGPYENLMQTYMAWEKFVKDNEVVLTGPTVELYKVSMGDTEDPAEYKTVIYQSVESKGKLGMMDEDEMMDDGKMMEEEKSMEEEKEMMEEGE